MNFNVKYLGCVDYQETWQSMFDFTHQRDDQTTDELWLLEHPRVFTLGQAGDSAHVLQTNGIPVINTDRGGQVTYHAPGQLVGYCLFDIARLKIGVRQFVTALENTLIQLLEKYDVKAEANPKAPGVYVDNAKIASLGLRLHKLRSYHGFALNIDLDLTPFSWINPCGIEKQKITSMHKLGVAINSSNIQQDLTSCLQKQLEQIQT